MILWLNCLSPLKLAFKWAFKSECLPDYTALLYHNLFMSAIWLFLIKISFCALKRLGKKENSMFFNGVIANTKSREAGKTAKKQKQKNNSRQHCWTELICPCQIRCLQQWIVVYGQRVNASYSFVHSKNSDKLWMSMANTLLPEWNALCSVPCIFVRYFLPRSQSAHCILVGGICRSSDTIWQLKQQLNVRCVVWKHIHPAGKFHTRQG